ncbi:M48 metallopeptidase family protein [Kytococcus sp. Marseille-QA3725]
MSQRGQETGEQPWDGVREDPEVVITRSPRRRKTLSARWQDGRVAVAVPAGMPPETEARAVDELVQKVLRKRRNASDVDLLLARTRRLGELYLDGLAVPTDIRWVANQHSRWGSCTSGRGTIRLSDSLQDMPEWVVDAVIVHELAHLLERGHGPAFRAWVERYPRYAEAMAFLDGVSHGWAHPRP